MILNRFAPLSVRSNPRSLLVGRRVGRFVASLEKCSATKFRCWAVRRPPPGPPGGQAPARAPGGAGFKGQRPLRTVSPPLEANSASPACYCWSHPRCSSLSLSAVSERAVRFSPAFLSSGGVVCCWLAAWCCTQCEPRKARRVKFVMVPSPAVEHGEF